MNREEKLKKQREWDATLKRREAKKEFEKIRMAERPYQLEAKQAVRRAVLNGTIKKPNSSDISGETELQIVGHHFDYSKKLDVVWLNKSEHVLLHSKTPSVKRDQIRKKVKKFVKTKFGSDSYMGS
jgi:hypothetical protein